MTRDGTVGLRTHGPEIVVRLGAVPVTVAQMLRLLVQAGAEGFATDDPGLWIDGRAHRRDDAPPLTAGVVTVAPWHRPAPRWIPLAPTPDDHALPPVRATLEGDRWRIGAHPTFRIDGRALRMPTVVGSGAVLAGPRGAWLLDGPPRPPAATPRRPTPPVRRRFPWIVLVPSLLTSIVAFLWLGPVGLAFGAIGLVSLVVQRSVGSPSDTPTIRTDLGAEERVFVGADAEGAAVFGSSHRPARSSEAETEDPRRLAWRPSGRPTTLPGATLGQVLQAPPSPAAVDRWWGLSGTDAAVPVLVDAGSRPVALDLFVDGPHALVVGTTGSGKSELLRTWLLGLALRHSPDALGLVLIDFKGGSAFDDLARLPHARGMVTDLDDDEIERALVSLEVELRSREERSRAAGAEHRPRALGRLVVAVDEFSVLADGDPNRLDRFIDIARRGRSLGMHLVLAAQRPGAALRPDLLANIGLRIAMRVQDPEDSRAVIGVTDAASLPLTAGVAWVWVGGTRTWGRAIRSDVATPDRATLVDHRDREVRGPVDDLRRWVDACRRAYPGVPPEPVVPAPLPADLGDGVALAVDDVAHRRIVEVPAADLGHLGLVGRPNAAAPILCAIARRWRGSVTVVARRPPSALARGSIDPDDVWAIERLRHRLEQAEPRRLAMLLEPARLFEDDVLGRSVDEMLKDPDGPHRLVVVAEREAAIPSAVAGYLERLVHLSGRGPDGRGHDDEGRAVQMAVDRGSSAALPDGAVFDAMPALAGVAPDGDGVLIGIDHPEGRPLMFDPAPGRVFVVCGGPGTGKTTLLRRIASGLSTAGPVAWVGDDPAPTGSRPFPDVVAASETGLRVVVEDADVRVDRPLPPGGEEGKPSVDRPSPAWIVGLDPARVGYVHPLAELRGRRWGVVLGPVDEGDGEFFGVRLRDARRRRFRPGDGAFVDGRPRWFHRAEGQPVRAIERSGRHRPRTVVAHRGAPRRGSSPAV